MAELRYRLIFEGKVLPGQDPETAKTAFARRFGVKDAQLPKLFSGRPVVLKANLDGPSVKRLGRALTDVGVTYRVENEVAPAASAVEGKQPPAPVQLEHQPPASWEAGKTGEPVDQDLAPWESPPDSPDLGSAGPPVQRQRLDHETKTFAETIAEHQRSLVLIVGFAAVSLVLLIVIRTFSDRPVSQPPGILAAEEPVQEIIESGPEILHRGHRLIPRATIQLKARVLGVKTYTKDRAALVCNTDLALGWGYMSDSRVLEKLSYYQEGRFFLWHARRLPAPRDTLQKSQANMHVIPADDLVQQVLDVLREGELIQFEGRLVDVVGPEGWEWFTSLEREDEGAGACEIVWVEAIRILPTSR
ncbi:MAG: hypothetical protein QNK37_35735 [Acidobacteriota bacterium]|nr:hypothetical protein [Acidobacteriota bacterium]